MAVAQVYIFLLEQIIIAKSKNNQNIGVTLEKRKEPLVVSLTSVPKRLDKLFLTLETLLSQTIKPDYITLWLGDDISKIPESIKRLEPRGVHVFFRKDIGSFKKAVYTLQEFPHSLLVTADDDILYPKNWLENLYTSYLENPNIIPCHNGNVIQFSNGGFAPYRSWPRGSTNASLLIFPFTGPGALYPIGSLHSDVCNEDLFQQLCPNNDDIWMKFMSLLTRTPCRMVNPIAKRLYEVTGSQAESLNKKNSRINEYIRNVAQHYGITKEYFENNNPINLH